MSTDRHRHDGPVPTGDLPGTDEDATAALLRDAMVARAEAVQPEDRLAAIRAGAAARHRRSRLTAVAGVAAALVIATGTGIALTGQDPQPGRSAVVAAPQDTASAPTGAPTTAPTPAGPSGSGTDGGAEGGADATGGTAGSGSTAGSTGDSSAPPSPGTSPAPASVPVYWLGGGDNPAGPKLYREFLPATGTADAPTQALRLMLAGDPVDEDYSSPWRADPDATAHVGADLITVDVSRAAFANTDIGSGVAGMAVQQLVHTVTAAAGRSLPVEVLVDGQRGAEAWGVIGFTEPITRAAPLDVQALVWITSPADGAVVDAGPLEVRGVGTGFEATLDYVLRDGAGQEVARGFTTAGANGEFGEFTIPLEVEPGTYTISVAPADASGGQEGFPPMPDTKDIVVR